MMRALYSGVAGLKTHQTKMDVIGNNIANVNTTSYKSQSITFSDLMYQTTQTASGATETKGGINPRQIGLGAKSGAINTAITSQGTSQTTNNPFDIMINGSSFFVVNNGVENLYTRDGSFYVDGSGNLAMQSNGYLVQGWPAREDRETGEITVNRNGGLSGLQIMSPANFTYSPASTTASVFQGNIDDNDTNLKAADGKAITLEFYDNKGYMYTGKFTLKDTENSDLFALTLTDIIDSNGKSINENKDKADLMSQITLGDVSSTKRTIKNDPLRGYSVEATTDPNYINFIKSDGDVKFNDIPANGNLIDLENKGILRDAYGLSRASLENKYTKDGFENATYQIGANGALTVIYPKIDIANGVFGDSYKDTNFTTQNSDNYFIDENTQIAYKVPTENLRGSVNDIADLLRDVFDVDAGNYAGFKYSNGGISLFKELSYFKDETINPNESYTDIKDFGSVNDDMVSRDFGQFEGLVEAINKYKTDGGLLENLKCTYSSNGKMMLTQRKLVEKNQDVSTNLDTLQNSVITSMLGKFGTTYSWGGSVSDIPYSVINKIANSSPDVENEGRTFSQEEIDTAKAIKDTIDAAFSNVTDAKEDALKESKFKLVDLNGDAGIIIKYTSTEEEELSFPGGVKDLTKSYPFNRIPADTLDSNDYKNNFVFNGNPPAYVYQNKNLYGKSYYVANDLLTRTFKGDNSQAVDFIKAVFPDASYMNFDPNAEYDMVINEKGEVTIKHKVQDTTTYPVLTATTGYSAKINEDGTVMYTSTSAYKNVPVKGKIADLLSAAKNSNQQQLLEKVYGITDNAADAYGLDGTYEIITAEGTDKGKINLTLGNHTIQLAFDPATGAIVSADGNSLDKKANITFGLGGQTTEGLEAFGFQASPTNAAELERNHTISVDFSTLTNYRTNGASTIRANKGDMKSLNTGRAVGEMNGVNVSDNGMIYANYSNGQTKLLGQIASAQFANASGLSKQGDNLYASTLNSGDATIQDITTDGGYMSTGVLEMSNVDLSAQFTEMITTQRGFQANSRIITVSDTLLEELTNLKR